MKNRAVKRGLATNFIIYLFRTIVITSSSLIIFPYVSRILGATNIGKVQYIQSIASYFQLFAAFGIASYGIREGSKLRDNPKELNELFNVLIYLNALLTAISLIFYLVIARIALRSSYGELINIFAIYVIVYGMNFDWYFNVYENYGYLTLRSVIGALISLAIVFGFIHVSSDYRVYAISLVVPYGFNFLMNGIQIIREVKFQRVKIRRLLSYLVPIGVIFSIIIATNIYALLDTTMLGAMIGDTSVGMYTAASKLTRLGSSVITGVFGVFTPRMTYYIGINNRDEFNKLATSVANLIIFVGLPLSVFMMLFSTQLITLYSGSEYICVANAMRLMAFTFFLSILDCFMGWQLLVPIEKEKIMLWATIVGSVIDLVLNVILIPKYSVMGAAIATSIAEIVVFCILFYNCYRMIDIKRVVLSGTKCLLAVFVLSLLVRFFNLNNCSVQQVIFLVLPITSIIYLILLYMFKNETLMELLQKAKKLI